MLAATRDVADVAHTIAPVPVRGDAQLPPNWSPGFTSANRVPRASGGVPCRRQSTKRHMLMGSVQTTAGAGLFLLIL